MVATLDPDGLDLVSGIAAITAMVEQRVRWIRDEWYLSPDEGVNYREIQGGTNREDDAVLEFLTNIREVTGVTGARSAGYSYTGDRRLRINFVVETIEGTFTTETVL